MNMDENYTFLFVSARGRRGKQEETVKQTEKQTLNSPQKHHIYLQHRWGCQREQYYK